MPPSQDDTSSLERARSRLYEPGVSAAPQRPSLSAIEERVLPHAWKETIVRQIPHRRMRFATVFFGGAFFFFLLSLSIAGYVFYSGSNSVSTEKIVMAIKGPTTIAGGDTLPLTLTITNTNPVAVTDAVVSIEFPVGTRDASDVTKPYQRYTENIGSLASGATVTRSLNVIVFGEAGKSLNLPASFSYRMSGSNSAYVKESTYVLGISSTPVDVSVVAPTETVSGKPLTFTLTVRSNTTVPLSNVVLAGTFPFGFSPSESSVPMSNSSFLLGTLAPGATKNITLTGTLTGQDSEERVFRFSIGTAKTAQDQTLAVTYLTQEAAVAIVAPFISASLAINGDASPNIVIPAGTRQSVSVSYANKLPTSIRNVNVAVAISGNGIDYSSIETTRGFYNSRDRTILFSQETDPLLANLSPGASGLGVFTFATVPAGSLTSSPSITFTTSVSGTRTGESNVPDEVQASVIKTVKVQTAAVVTAVASYSSGPIANTGPVPPVADQTTTYAVVWNVKNQGSAVAGGTVSAVLPSYVSYTGQTSGVGSFSYDATSRTVTWKVGDLSQGTTAQGVFQVSFTPSTSQKGKTPSLTGVVTFSGFDRFAGVPVKATASPATTETPGDPGYVLGSGSVQ